jgi:hypothetical protein
MSETPRTDAVAVTPVMHDQPSIHKWEQLVLLARTLERELAAAEREINARKGDAVTRLHNICRGLEEPPPDNARVVEIPGTESEAWDLLRRIVAGWHQSGSAEVWAADALSRAAELVEKRRKAFAASTSEVERQGDGGGDVSCGAFMPKGPQEDDTPSPVPRPSDAERWAMALRLGWIEPGDVAELDELIAHPELFVETESDDVEVSNGPRP